MSTSWNRGICLFDQKKLRQALRLYAVTSRNWLGKQTLAGQVEQALRGGATMVQLREKTLCDRELLQEAQAIKLIAAQYGVPLILNDRPDLVERCGADGVHIGQGDCSAAQARREIGPERILGISAHSVDEALRAQEEGADYLGVGAAFGSATKTDAVTTSPDVIRAICRAVELPVVAIGGIDQGNIHRLSGCGLAGVAVVSALFAQPDVRGAAQRMRVLSERVTAG